MTNDMVGPEDLDDRPGAPFSETEVDAAVAAMRKTAGWHIAPKRPSETVYLDVGMRERVLRLPTLKLDEIADVRDATGDDPVTIEPGGYRASRRTGLVRRTGGYWPAGYEAVEVDMTHGYDETPPDLLPLIAQLALTERRDRSVRTVSVDDASTTYANATTALAGIAGRTGALAPYVIPVVR
ncbi:hypothetical protein GCM10009718_33250 [Isoptericola halotolerans]|uniref:Head-to-tail adaptor n=1 Tax=Isoptericola halotolerans TaxID=300560 RepID=A0ABX2A5W8_9MICO|nr:hypothetical protein [Isoptericola halotolerans]NOV98213.1 hypothetical protein [Isoptericola halotolerans]